MLDSCQDKEGYAALLHSLEEMTKEYKAVTRSWEYCMGELVAEYRNLVKGGHFGQVIKNLYMMKKGRSINQSLPASPKQRKDAWYFSDKRIAVYTAVFGSYDEWKEPLIHPDNIDYFIITDQRANGGAWKKLDAKKLLPKEAKSNTEKNRFFKMMPHLLFPEYEYSVYVDGNVWITSDLTPLTAGLEQFPLAMHRHKNRVCVYDEIDACLFKKKDTKEQLHAHRRVLRTHKVPRNYGLLEATVIARKHHDPLCRGLMEQWWKAFMQNSRRDQISLIDCLWKNGIAVNQVATLGDNISLNDSFIIQTHQGK